jgi:hypothetical protein
VKQGFADLNATIVYTVHERHLRRCILMLLLFCFVRCGLKKETMCSEKGRKDMHATFLLCLCKSSIKWEIETLQGQCNIDSTCTCRDCENGPKLSKKLDSVHLDVHNGAWKSPEAEVAEHGEGLL